MRELRQRESNGAIDHKEEKHQLVILAVGRDDWMLQA
jgi:hypothetical protein